MVWLLASLRPLAVLQEPSDSVCEPSLTLEPEASVAVTIQTPCPDVTGVLDDDDLGIEPGYSARISASSTTLGYSNCSVTGQHDVPFLPLLCG